MIIKPFNNKIQLEIDQPTAGGLDLSSKPTTVECGIIKEVGENVKELKKGDRIFFKAWATDIITYNKETYYFIDSTSEGICAIVQE